MNRNANSFAAILILVAAGLVIACAGAARSTTPSTSAPTSRASTSLPASQPPGTPANSQAPAAVTSAAHAAALVFASDARWAQITPLRPDMIGQSTWYEAFAGIDAFLVNITAGSGDCQAGCIDQHVWHYEVDPGGNVLLIGEDGDDVDVTPGTGDEGDVKVVVQLSSGPTCPVETIPPDPNCAERAVANAEVTIFDAQGDEVGRTTSDAQGTAQFSVPAGAYFVVPAAAGGLMGTPQAQAFSALGGDEVGLLVAYDTGIR